MYVPGMRELAEAYQLCTTSGFVSHCLEHRDRRKRLLYPADNEWHPFDEYVYNTIGNLNIANDCDKTTLPDEIVSLTATLIREKYPQGTIPENLTDKNSAFALMSFAMLHYLFNHEAAKMGVFLIRSGR